MGQTPNFSGVAPLAALVDSSGNAITKQNPAYFEGYSALVNAVGTTLTRPANTTAYSANDSMSDNATAGSVMALPVTVADKNDAPILLTEIHVDTNDTGLAASTQIRAYVYNSDPTANSGVKAGDNVAFSNNRAGLIGTFSGAFTAMADGGKARLVSDAGSYLICLPETGGQRLWVQYQTLGAFAPSANSTTIACRLKGFQGRA